MMKMMKKPTIATERSDFRRLVSKAIKEAYSESVSGVDRCLDIVRHLKSLRLASKDIFRFSGEIQPLANLTNHGNPKIQMGVHDLLNSWIKTLFASGREEPFHQKSHAVDDKACSDQLKKKKKEDGTENPRLKRVWDVTFKYPLIRIRLHQKQTKLDVTKSKNKEDERSKAHKTSKIQQKELKKQETAFKKMIKPNPKYCPALKKKKKSETELLELFNIAKKSADVANAKGLLAAKSETSICVDTLALLMDFPISETDPETKGIMVKLQHLTRHKDRRVCNSASALLHHWKQSMMK